MATITATDMTAVGSVTVTGADGAVAKLLEF